MVLLLFTLTGMFAGIIAPIWWVLATRKKWPHWKIRWWAVVLGVLLLMGGSTQPAPPPSNWRLLLNLERVFFSISELWLIAWGVRGKKSNWDGRPTS
jgi:hypothetical protein